MTLPRIHVTNLQRAQATTGPDARRIAARIVRNDAGTGPTRVDVYDDIGASWWGGGVSAADFQQQISAISGDLEVHINSGGGDVWDGIAIYNAIAGRPGKVTTVVDGLAASIASVIMQAGQQRIIAPGAMVMIHDALSVCIGNAADMRATADLLDTVSGNLADIYAARGGTPDEWRAAMTAESWYTAQQAIEAGLADVLAERPAAPEDVAAHDFRVFAHVPRWLRAAAGQDEQGPACKTCDGTGRLKHHSTGKPSVKCPSCNGTGTAPSGDEDDDEQSGSEENRARPLLGVESMPLIDGPIPVHHTATVDTSWDGPAAVKAMDAEYKELHYCHAWETDEASESSHTAGDDDADDKKSSYKFPHHAHDGSPANIHACQNGLARLEGSTIPEADKAGVRAHLQAHLDDAKGTDDHHHGAESAWWDPHTFKNAFEEAING